jgi:hypothetical protein
MGFFNSFLKATNLVFGDGISRQVQHEYRVVELAEQNRNQVEQLELRNSQNRDLQIIMHELRIDFERARRRMESSPFFHDDLDTADLLWREFKAKGLPLFLVSPFWDETKTNMDSDAGGGDAHFRTAISGAWHEIQYDAHGLCLDGIFRRPLRQTDMDVLWIRNTLKDLPIVLSYGYTDGKSVHPVVSTWNVLPDTPRNQISTFHGKALLPGERDDEEFRQLIGQAIVGVTGAVMGVTEDGKNLYLENHNRLTTQAEQPGDTPRSNQDSDLLSQVNLILNSKENNDE